MSESNWHIYYGEAVAALTLGMDRWAARALTPQVARVERPARGGDWLGRAMRGGRGSGGWLG